MFPIRYRRVSHQWATYHILARRDVTTGRVDVETLDMTGVPVAVTFPDGYCASLVHQVDLITEIDLLHTHGVDAVDLLVDTAESDLRRLV